MHAAHHSTTGGLDVLRYGEVDDPPPPGPAEVLIRVRASSLDRVDLYFREGSHGMTIREQPYIGGRDIAGDVIAVGNEVANVHVGQAVVASGARAHAELALAPAELTLALPPNCSYERAAAIPTAGRSAYQALVERVHIAEGETVLVTAAGSGVGSFGVQIARASGCTVIATTSVRAGANVDKLACAREIGASIALDSRRDDLYGAVIDATNGQGVDVVLDHVGTPLWDSVIRTLRPWGRYVTTGVTGGHRVDLHLGQVFVKGLTITGVGRPSNAQIRRTLEGLLSLVASGDVEPRIAATFALSQIGDAHALMASDDFFGKIVLTV
ncbi:MAG: zinc-binding dehydrogenase, partial [Acidimicrobiales bacterium]